MLRVSGSHRTAILPKTTRTPVAQYQSVTDALERETRRALAQASFPYFMSYYLRTDDEQEFSFKDFHVEMMDLFADITLAKVLALEPASFGKSTILKGYCIWLGIHDPNIRIALGGKTFDDATRRLRTIKSELESNPRLIEDFGPFVGDVWKEDQINLAGRTSKAKEATITCFGSETNVFGWRADVAVLDDIVTNANSGPQVKDGTRERLRDNFFQGVMKMGTVGKAFLVRWVNTVVDRRDLTHEVGDLKSHPASSDTRWVAPNGWNVVRRQSINDLTGEALWPEVYPPSKAAEDRATDVVMFLKRMQNQCLEPELMPFRQEWIRGTDTGLPGCLDSERAFGVKPAGDLTVVIGYDPDFGLSERAKYCGCVVLGFDKSKPEPRPYHVIEAYRFRMKQEEQAEFLIALYDRVHASGVTVEVNAANRWLVELRVFQDATKRGANSLRLIDYTTTGPKKRDADTGIPALAGTVKAGLLRLPYGDDRGRAISNIIESEMVEYPMGQTSDMLMAAWFAMIAASEVGRRGLLHVVKRPLPDWAQPFGGRAFAATRTVIGR